MPADRRRRGSSPTVKLLACVALVLCLVAGAIGLILPIVPGIVFLAIAALIAVRHFPALGARLRRHRGLGGHLERADRFLDLPLPRKLQVAGLLCVKLVLDALDAAGALVSRAFARASRVAARR